MVPRPVYLAAILLSVHGALLAWGATRHSPSIDEVGHIAAGLSHWQFGRFDLYRVNPPLVRLAATAPVALLHPLTNWSGYSLAPGARSEFNCGEQFIAANGRRSFWLFSVARWACIPLSMLGGFVCWRWAGDLYGAAGGLLALTLWCFGPNILAHAQMITPDAGATALGAAACYLFWRWLREPSWVRAFAGGVTWGLAELTKTTLVVLYAIWPLAWIVWSLTAAKDRPAGKPIGRQAGQFILMAVLSVYVLNLGYAFEGSFQPLGRFHFISQTLGGPLDRARPDGGLRNRFAETALAGFRVPLPANYLLGIDHQKSDFEDGYDSYLRGEWRHGGWWYYYLYGLAIKVPLGTWALFVLAGIVGLTLRVARRWAGVSRSAAPTLGAEGEPNQGATWRDEFVLLLPAVTILSLVSSQTGFNHHLRYVLPIFPFVFIWIGRLGKLFATRDILPGHRVGTAPATFVRWIVALAIAWSIGGSLWYYPHSLSYFNELVGGPLGGRWHLLDSNIDWGQDLLYLKAWLDDHPQAKPLGLAYFGYPDPRIAGIEFSLPPKGPLELDGAGGENALPVDEVGPRPGWYAVSVMMLHAHHCNIPDGHGGRFYVDRPYFSYFQRFEPVARAGYSIYIYHIGLAEANRARRRLGLPPLPGTAGEAPGEEG